MKVVQVLYKGTARNVFVYDGLDSSEVWKLLRSVVAGTLAPGEREPRILALREPASGRVLPLSQALQRVGQLWPKVELIVQDEPTNYTKMAAGASRPQSSPATQFASNSSSQAGLPTPIARNAAGASGAGSRASPLDTPAAYGQAYGAWGYSSTQGSPQQHGLQEQDFQRARAAALRQRGGALRQAAVEDSPPASPTFSASSSGSSAWQDADRVAGSGIHVMLQYAELLDVLTGHAPPNLNNGQTPRSVRTGRQPIYVLAVVRPGSDACEDIFPHYERLASRGDCPNLVFLIMEDVLLQGTPLHVGDAAPVFQFFLQGHLLGQLVQPTVAQLAKMIESTQRLADDRLFVQSDDEEEEEESEEEEYEDEEVADADEAADAYYARAAAARFGGGNRGAFAPARGSPNRSPRGSASYSLGEAIDDRFQLSEQERREIFSNVQDEEARWAQLLQASPKASKKRRRRNAWGASASPSPSASEGSEADEGSEAGYEVPGLVIRGQKIQLHPPVRQQAAARRSPEDNLRDWSSYEDLAQSSGVDESHHGSDSEEEWQRHAYNAAAQHEAGRKRKPQGPPACSSDEEAAGVADGGSDYSDAESVSPSLLATSLTASPVMVSYGPSNPNGIAPVRGPLAPASGVLMSASEAVTIERLLLRRDPDVLAAFRACPDLSSLMSVFLRLVQTQVQQPPQATAAQSQQQQQGSGAAAAQATLAGQGHGMKRKKHEQQVTEEPKYKRPHSELTPAQLLQQTAARVAAARAEQERMRHKRVNQQVYASSSDDEDDAQSPPIASHARSRSELAAQSDLQAQQARFHELQSEYAAIQNEIFSRTIHDLHQQALISDQQLHYLIHLWTATESGSNAIRRLIKRYEKSGDEVEFMWSLTQLVGRFEAGEPVAPSESEGGESAEASDSQGSEDESDGASPLDSDEERQFRQYLAEVGSSPSPSASESPSSQASPARPPRSSTKAPQTTPAEGTTAANRAGVLGVQSASEQQEAALSSNLALIDRLGSAGLLTASENQRAQQYTIHGHPLMQAAFMAFSYNNDVEDLLDTIRQVLAQETRPSQEKKSKSATDKAPSAAAAAASSASSATSLSPSDLLALLPPSLVSAHGLLIEQLVLRRDHVLLAAWDVLKSSIGRRRGADLVAAVEELVDTVQRRVRSLVEAAEKEGSPKKQQQQPGDEVDGTSDDSIAESLQIAAVLHTGGVFGDEDCAVLFALILQSNPVVRAAFDLAREDEQWDELHDTLLRLLERHADLKSPSHPLLPLVRQATGTISAQTVKEAREIMDKYNAGQSAKAAPAAASSSKQTTPARASAPLPPAATPQSPSIPQSAWSRMVSQFSRSLEHLQSRSALSDAAALRLIDLFQTRHPALVAACEVLELDGSEAEFEDTLLVIAAENSIAPAPTSAPAEAGSGGSAQKQSASKSFAQRVQEADEEAERSEAAEEDEDDEDDEEEEDEDASPNDAALERLLAKASNADWRDDEVDALLSQVSSMQLELRRLKRLQAAEAGLEDSSDAAEDSDEEDLRELLRNNEGEDVGDEQEDGEDEEEEDEEDAE